MSASDWIETAKGGTRLHLLVVPRASRTELSGVQEGRLKVRVAAPPVEGEANKAIVKFFAKLLGVGRSAVSIASGETGRRKVVVVEDLDEGRIREAVERVIGDAG